MQFISTGPTVTSSTVHDLKEFKSQYLSTQGKKGGQLFSMVPAIIKAFDLMGDDIVEIIYRKRTFEKWKRFIWWEMVERT